MKVRIAVAAALALGVALGTSGCNLIQPQATTYKYDPSDGISVDTGDVELRNIVVISDTGKVGNLIMNTVNTTGADLDLTIEFVSKDKVVAGNLSVPYSEQSVAWGTGKNDLIILEGIATEPGGMLEMSFQSGDGEAKTVLVPVLNSELPEYAGLNPAAVIKSEVAETKK